MATTKPRKTWRSTMQKRRTQSSPTLGAFLRGVRHGYHWSAKYHVFVRISAHRAAPEQASVFKVEVRPLDAPIGTRGEKSSYFVWWSAPEILDMIAPLRPLLAGRLVISQTLLVDEGGYRVQGPPLTVEVRPKP